KRQGARDRVELLHAAGKLPGEFALETRQVDEFQVALDAPAALGGIEAHDFKRKRDVTFDGAPGIKRRRLEDITVMAFQPRLFGRDAIDQDRSGARLLQVGDDAQERGFAATRRSDERDEIAAIDLQVDVAERLHLAVAGLKGERDAARVDRQSWSGGGRFETRPRAVCATRPGAARRLRQGPQYHHQLRPGGRFARQSPDNSSQPLLVPAGHWARQLAPFVNDFLGTWVSKRTPFRKAGSGARALRPGAQAQAATL